MDRSVNDDLVYEHVPRYRVETEEEIYALGNEESVIHCIQHLVGDQPYTIDTVH